MWIYIGVDENKEKYRCSVWGMIYVYLYVNTDMTGNRREWKMKTCMDSI